MPTGRESPDISGQIRPTEEKILDSLNKLNDNIDKLNAHILNMSQTQAKDERSSHFRDTAAGTRAARVRSGRSFSDSFSDAFTAGISSEFKATLNKHLAGFAADIGVDMRNVSGSFGDMLGKQVADAIKNSSIGQSLQRRLNSILDSTLSNLRQGFMRGVASYDRRHGTSNISQMFRNRASAATQPSGTSVTNVGGQVMSNMLRSGFSSAGAAGAGAAGAGAAGAGAAGAGAIGGGALMSGAASALLSAGPQIALLLAFEKLTDALSPAIEGISNFVDALKVSANRYDESRKKNLEAADRRLKADMETLVKKPFEILEAAATNLYDAWDNNLRTITATQGYNKSDVQDLMAAIAERLRSEGLTDVISGSDIINNLSKVLQSGLSGKVAEEFAYQATVLSASMPTQDFFGYASDYASIAANAIKNGKSQNQAIEEANKQLRSFANNTLYASRSLAGGFSTGLQNAEDLFNKAIKISQIARIGDSSQIAGVFTSVAAIVGATAPDLANSITDAVYQAAVGGNDSRLVALRSLAGVNASNTEFLRALARDPQKIFATLFDKLSKMYTDSSDAFMEKAEGYAELFGLSSEAFQRVDFNYLSRAISEMNVASSSLNENMALLQSGQTTLTAEQLKNREINKYMIEEGLSYVLDNEAARAIQQHMWDEQIAREMQETTYGIELKGKSLELLEGIRSAVKKTLSMLNPIGWFSKIGNISSTSSESAAMDAEIVQVLEAGKVGKGNMRDIIRLTSRNANLGLAQPLSAMLGSVSPYAISRAVTGNWNAISGQGFSDLGGIATSITSQIPVSGRTGSASSKYNWGVVSKSQAASAFKHTTIGTTPTAPVRSASTPSGTSTSRMKSIFNRILSEDYMKDFMDVQNPKSYQDWVKSARSFGIADMAKAAADAGYTEAQLQDYFESKQVEAGGHELKRLQDLEESFWSAAKQFYEEEFPENYEKPILELLTEFKEKAIEFYTVSFPQNYQGPLFSKLDTLQTSLNKHYLEVSTFYKKWEVFLTSGDNTWIRYSSQLQKMTKAYSDYFLNEHTFSAYAGNTNAYAKVQQVQSRERNEQGDAIYALADVLTQNSADLSKPAAQTNALLAQILQVVSAIMNQNNESAGARSLADSLSALSLGLTQRT